MHRIQTTLQRLAVLLCLVTMFTTVGSAAEIDASPGIISPDSLLYRLDIAADNIAASVGLRNRGDIAEERAAEARAMVEKGDMESAARALNSLNDIARDATDSDRLGMQTAAEHLQQTAEQAPDSMQEDLQNTAAAAKKGSIPSSPPTPEPPANNILDAQLPSPPPVPSAPRANLTGATPNNDSNETDDNTTIDRNDCRQNIQQAQEFAQGRTCTQQIQTLQCPSDNVTYQARNGCEINYLTQHGWIAPTPSNQTTTQNGTTATVGCTDLDEDGICDHTDTCIDADGDGKGTGGECPNGYESPQEDSQ